MQNSRILIAVLCAALGGVFGDSALGASAKKAAAEPVAGPAKSAAPVVKKKIAGPDAPKATKARTVPAARARRRGSRVVRRVYVPRQGQPSKERYTEIQQALVQRGYYSGEPNGQWNNESADALKRFQDDQSLQASGKINSLSLIALGLGPKRNPMGSLPVVAPAPVASPTEDEQEEPIELPPAPVVAE